MGNVNNSVRGRMSIMMKKTGQAEGGTVADDKMQAVAIEAVRVGSRIASKAQAECASHPSLKKDSSPVTAADFAVQASICHILNQSYPDMKLLGEEDDENFKTLDQETKAKVVEYVSNEFPELNTIEKVEALISKGNFGKNKDDKPPCFVLDPIDGTKGFLRGEQYAVCLGFLEADGRVSLGILGCPNMPGHFLNKDVADSSPKGFLFEARLGHGARVRPLFPEDEKHDVPLLHLPRDLKSSSAEDKVVFAESYEKSHQSGKLPQVLFSEFGIKDEEKEVLRIDSQVKFAALARGDVQAYFRFTSFDLAIWDVLPGYCLLTEAGGRVTSKQGEPINFLLGRSIKSNNLIATHAGGDVIHERMIKAIAQAEAATASTKL